MTKHAAASPQQVLGYLEELFPGFAPWRDDDEVADEPPSYHRIMMEFIQFFSRHHGSFTDKQLKRFGEW